MYEKIYLIVTGFSKSIYTSTNYNKIQIHRTRKILITNGNKLYKNSRLLTTCKPLSIKIKVVYIGLQ